MRRDAREPYVLADGDAEPHTAKRDDVWQGSGGEDSLLVEDAVIRQLVFATNGADPSLLEQDSGVVQGAVVLPRRCDKQGGPGCRFEGEYLNRVARGIDYG